MAVAWLRMDASLAHRASPGHAVAPKVRCPVMALTRITWPVGHLSVPPPDERSETTPLMFAPYWLIFQATTFAIELTIAAGGAALVNVPSAATPIVNELNPPVCAPRTALVMLPA